MKILIVICHPNPESFSHAIADTVTSKLRSNNHTIISRDLYKEAFDPVLPYSEIIGESLDPVVIGHISDLQQAEGLVIIHPNWWGKPPAMLAGWIDRVFRMNAAYTFPKGGEGGAPTGLLKLANVMILNTANTTPEREENVFGDPLELIWRNCVFDFCGVRNITRKTFSVIVDSSSETRKDWLNKVEEMTDNMFPKITT